MVSRGAHFDDASFLLGGRVEDMWRSLTFLLNGIIFFIDIIYKKVLTFCLCKMYCVIFIYVKKIITFGDILILMLLGNKVYAEPPTTMANMRDRIITECNKMTPNTLYNVDSKNVNDRHTEPFL